MRSIKLYSNCTAADGQPASQVGYGYGGGDSPCREVAQASVDDLAGACQVVETTHDLFDRGYAIVKMCKIEVDMVGLQPLQALFDRLHHHLAAVAQNAKRGVRLRTAGVLGDEDEVVAIFPDEASDQTF